jgi:hypothetical protein
MACKRLTRTLSAIVKRRQPFTCFNETGGTQTKTEGTTNSPKRTSNANAVIAALRSDAIRAATLASSGGAMRSIASRRACPELVEGMVQWVVSVVQAGASFETPALRAPQDKAEAVIKGKRALGVGITP